MNIPRNRVCDSVTALVLATLSGCGGGASTSLTELIPVSLAAFPAESSVEQFLETGTVSTSDGRSVKIVDTGEFSVPSDRGLAACGRSLGNVEGSGPLFSVDGRFRTETTGDFDDAKRGQIANSIVLLSEDQIRDLAAGSTDEIAVHDSNEGKVVIRAPKTEQNSSSGFQIATQFGKWKDTWEPWDVLCTTSVSVGFDDGKALMVLTDSLDADGLITAQDGMTVTEPEYLAALRVTLQVVHGKAGTMATAKNALGETYDLSVGMLDS